MKKSPPRGTCTGRSGLRAAVHERSLAKRERAKREDEAQKKTSPKREAFDADNAPQRCLVEMLNVSE